MLEDGFTDIAPYPEDPLDIRLAEGKYDDHIGSHDHIIRFPKIKIIHQADDHRNPHPGPSGNTQVQRFILRKLIRTTIVLIAKTGKKSSPSRLFRIGLDFHRTKIGREYPEFEEPFPESVE